MLLYLILVSWLSPHLVSDVHDFHLSKTEIYHNQKTQSLEITMHIFIDDLELAISQAQGTLLRLTSTEDDKQADTTIVNYLQSEFAVWINAKKMEFTYLGKEESEDLIAFWIYLEATGVREIEEIQIKNSILTEIYQDQKNMVSIETPNYRKFFLLDHVKTEAALKL